MRTQLEKIQAVIYKARWVGGGIATDKAIAEALLEAGLSIPQPADTNVLRSPCCGVPVYIQNGWDGSDAFAECDCGSEWGMDGKLTYG